MYSKYFRTLVGLAFSGALAIATMPCAHAAQDGAPSWCLSGSGDLQACGFASFEQCELARDGFAMCVANGKPAEPAYVEAERMYRAATANASMPRDANAGLVGPLKMRHRR